MLVKVIIRREIKEGKERQFFSLLKNIRSIAIHQDGYVSGETLVSAGNENSVLVISKWESMEAWDNWKNNLKRLEIDTKLNELQENPTSYEPYIFSRYRTADE